MLASIDLSTTHASRVPVEMTERVELTERIEMTECGRDDQPPVILCWTCRPLRGKLEGRQEKG